MAQPKIRFPVTSDPKVAEWNRKIEQAIGDATDSLDTRLTTVEDELMALAETATIMADALASIEQMTVMMAATARAQAHMMAQLVALTRGLPDPLLGEEGDALINQFINKDAP